jgi:hypothetical protein
MVRVNLLLLNLDREIVYKSGADVLIEARPLESRIGLQCCNRELQHKCCKNIGRLRFYHKFLSHASSFLTQSLLLPLQTKHFLIPFTSPLSPQTRSHFSFLLQQKNYAYETSEISRENFRVKNQQGSEGPNGFEVVLSLSLSLSHQNSLP